MPALEVSITGPIRWRLFSRCWWRFAFWVWVKSWFTPSGWKWRIVYRINARRPDLCWPKLCDWPLGYADSLGDAMAAAQWTMGRCAAEVAEFGMGWCGKCRRD